MEIIKNIIRKLSTPNRKKNYCGTTNQINRDKWLEKTLSEIHKGMRILDAGAGELRYKHLCSHLNYVSQDFGKYDGTGSGDGLHPGKWDNSKIDIVSDITKIPEPDGSFDAVMCIEVFEHLSDPIQAIRELTRLLKPGGHLILTAPFCALTHFSPFFFITGYSRNFYDYWLKELGYSIEDIFTNGNYFEYLAQELRRLPSVSKKYCQQQITKKDRKSINNILDKLSSFSANDTGSEELLSYGLCIKALKNSPHTS
jgi:2-polyprenyl-3-methyl-5-hydroxy-6-metoxy-1,4-benzoquinol methylase